MNETTVKCHICGDPYKVYPFYVGDQSACPDCVSKANLKMAGQLTLSDKGTGG